MSQYNTGNSVPSSDMRDAWDNNSTIDIFVSSPELKIKTRTGIERDTLAGIQKKAEDQRDQIALDGAAVIDETRQNLIPLSRQYMTLEDAQADIANIPEGSTTYYRSSDDSALAIEVINNSGVLSATGRVMPSQGYVDRVINTSTTNGNIVIILDDESSPVEVHDDFGGVNIPDVPGTLQEALAPVKTNRAPAILRLSDADNAAYGSVDDFGGLNLPGIPASVQHMLNNHQDKIQNLIRNGRVLDVRDCGFNAKTGENAVYAIQRAINWLSGQGGGVVYLPQANYLLSGYITPRSNVSIIGAGVDKSVLLPYKSFAAFRRIGNVNDYLQNVIMSDFTIDGANQVLNPTSGYLPEIKGTVILYWKDCVMDKLKMVNTGATALGNDMPYNCSIMRCYIENAGRLVPNRDAGIWERPLGASGIGLGTGALDDEPIYVAFNTVRKCANFGLFFEPQGGGAARGAVAIGNILEENYAGLADCGVDGLQAVSNQMRFNKFGILRYPGTNNDGKPGRRGQFIGNIVDSNTDHGIYSYSTKTDPLIGWNIYSNNQVTNNGKDGFNFRYTNPVVGMQNETVSGNHIYANGRHGINVEESLSVTNCDFLSNKIWGNGQKEAGNGVNSAVPFTACSINGNQIRDTQSTPTQQYPVNLTGVLTDVDISMNHCVGNVNNSINTSNSANQRVSKNINAGI
ncbi:glycosyl hydrolase family 28-related protein [Klebsiella aerogenes]|uniref:glycosyl hydrolase family 28-related protein n=1 Tax=Klebsiella aerogenes TaxID=548 RepID=UPI0024336DD1|nr:glycosyl hydrolase family 28-related protein [Klebsiella aerogenes]WFV97687.1 glycoside hydrolase family 55 protein [Klebsiella aerogenes]